MANHAPKYFRRSRIGSKYVDEQTPDHSLVKLYEKQILHLGCSPEFFYRAFHVLADDYRDAGINRGF